MVPATGILFTGTVSPFTTTYPMLVSRDGDRYMSGMNSTPGLLGSFFSQDVVAITTQPNNAAQSSAASQPFPPATAIEIPTNAAPDVTASDQ